MEPYWIEGISNPARRALENAGIRQPADFQRFTKVEVEAMHGIGPHAMVRILALLERLEIEFKKDE